MEFLVLGPLEVRRDGQAIEVRGSRRRALLALLILHANEVVRTDRLVDELWGEHPPANAPAALQNHVSRLRKDLGSDVLVTKPWGYVLRADARTIDLERFEALVAEARTLAAEERRERLREALALWRGPALADVASEPALTTEIARLEEVRLSALEQRIDADLELGGNRDLVAELEALVATHPLRERLRGQLILALYRAGRQAEALEAYRETRRVLVEELGIEPSPDLRELEQAILRQDPALAVAAPPPPAPEEDSHWQWPRSPLAVAAALLVLGGAGAVAGLLISAGGPPEGSAAPPISTTTTSSQTTAPEQPIGTTTTGKRQPPKKSNGKEQPGRPSTTAAVTTTLDEQPQQRPPPETTVSETEATTTATTTSQRQPQQEPQQQPEQTKRVYWLEDDFEDPVFDSLAWRSFWDSGISTAERGGRLEVSIDPGGVVKTDSFGASYTTQCTFSKDFDARVEYQLLTWPPRSGVFIFMSPAFQGPAPWTFVSRKGAPANGAEPERYSTGVNGVVPPEVPTVNTSGALRLTRVGTYITTYYRSYGTWVRLGRAYAPGAVRLVLGVGATVPEFGGEPAVVAFDNFRATASDDQYSVACQGVPYPPRRPAP